MRRKDREVTDRAELEAILSEAQVCRIAFATEGAPYIVALNFGFDWTDELCLYFHGASKGRKLDLMAEGGLVGFQLEGRSELVRGPAACDWGMRYSSIVGSGDLEELREPAERRRGLDLIMAHYGFEGAPHYNEGSMAATTVLRLRAQKMSGKRRA